LHQNPHLLLFLLSLPEPQKHQVTSNCGTAILVTSTTNISNISTNITWYLDWFYRETKVMFLSAKDMLLINIPEHHFLLPTKSEQNI
jgi:hypothetical protein